MRMSSPSRESESSPRVRPLNIAENITRTMEASRLITGNGAGSRHCVAQAGASAKQSAAHESSIGEADRVKYRPAAHPLCLLWCHVNT